MNQKPLCELTHIEALARVQELESSVERHKAAVDGVIDLYAQTIERACRLAAQVQHWQANHSNMVARCALLSQRDDLPIDRIPAYRELERLQTGNDELRVALDFVYRELYEPKEPLAFGMRGAKMFFSVGVQSFALDYEPTEPGEFEFMADMLTKAIARAIPPSVIMKGGALET